MAKLGIAADHAGFGLKEEVRSALVSAGHTVEDFGSYSVRPDDDYPDFVIPLAKAVAEGKVQRGLAICGVA